MFGGRFGLAVIDVSPAGLARFTSEWPRCTSSHGGGPARPRPCGPGTGLLAWTMVNDRPGSPVTDSSTYSILVGARSNQDIIHVDDAGIAWDWDSRDDP